jgi:hypothetical protein
MVSRSKEVETKISCLREEVMVLKKRTNEIGEDREEQGDIEKRGNCAIIQGLPEPTGDDGENWKTQNEGRIMDMLHEIKCDDVSIGAIDRLGKSPEAGAKPRPIKIVMESEAQKDKSLITGKNLGKQGQQRTRQDLNKPGLHIKAKTTKAAAGERTEDQIGSRRTEPDHCKQQNCESETKSKLEGLGLKCVYTNACSLIGKWSELKAYGTSIR